MQNQIPVHSREEPKKRRKQGLRLGAVVDEGQVARLKDADERADEDRNGGDQDEGKEPADERDQRKDERDDAHDNDEDHDRNDEDDPHDDQGKDVVEPPDPAEVWPAPPRRCTTRRNCGGSGTDKAIMRCLEYLRL